MLMTFRIPRTRVPHDLETCPETVWSIWEKKDIVHDFVCRPTENFRMALSMPGELPNATTTFLFGRPYHVTTSALGGYFYNSALATPLKHDGLEPDSAVPEM